VLTGYYAQNQDELLDGNLSVFETLDREAVGEVRARLRDIMGAFLFSGEAVDKKVKVLSGGERSRLAMMRLLLRPVNLLLMDEPTNHLDMRSKDILKEALRQYTGTLILVSHDRAFLEDLADKVFEFRDGRVIEYPGGINDFLEQKKLRSLRELEAGKPETGKGTSSRPDMNRQDYKEKKEQERSLRKLKQKIAVTEEKIGLLEKEIEDMNRRLSGEEGTASLPDDNSFFTDYETRKKELEMLMEEWTRLHEELERNESK